MGLSFFALDSTFVSSSFYLFPELESLVANNLLTPKFKFPFLNETIEIATFFKKNIKFGVDYRLAQDYESHETVPANASFSAQAVLDSSSYSATNKSKYTKDIKRLKKTQSDLPDVVNKKGPIRVFFFVSGNDSKLDSANVPGISLSSLTVKYKLRFQYKVFYGSQSQISGDVLNNILYKMSGPLQTANSFRNFNLVKSGVVVTQSGDMFALKEFRVEEDLPVTIIDDFGFFVDLKYDDSGTERYLPLLSRSLTSESLQGKSMWGAPSRG